MKLVHTKWQKLYSLLGEKNNALIWLEKSFQNHDTKISIPERQC